ncbi:ABC transporter ATP-binding protein [Croceicoccus mobilis]|uniref:ABC transporter ATP-binding protein n=1 Tax=Croceicoccus mobilis TaxID=1703339 RepID=A0A916YTV4_9SPHN|nr:ABC transporter ATP-binding protein [Croceicoccus mobilis]GGD61112.1 ABC transporter ATP-binding protein [Croceicoccus mobilis]
MIHAAITLLRSLPPGRLAMLFALMLAAALSEGVGLLMLVPMLSLLSGGESVAAGLPGWAAGLVPAMADGPGIAGLLGIFVALVAARAVLTFRLGVLQMQIQHRLVDEWRMRILDGLLAAGWRRLAQMRQAANASVLITQVDNIGDGFGRLLLLVTSAVTLAVIWAAAIALSPLVALIAALGGLAVLALFARLRRHAHAMGTHVIDQYETLQGEAQETLGALRLIKTHGRENSVSGRFAQAVRRLRQAQIAFLSSSTGSRAALQSGGALVLALVVWTAWSRGLALAVLLPLVVLFARSVPLLNSLQAGLQQWAHVLPAIQRAETLLAQLADAREPEAEPSMVARPEREIALHNVSLVHADRGVPALDDVSLVLPVGTMTALVGPSGAGKTSVADLFGALFAPDSGTLSIDGGALTGGALTGWRRQVAYLHQEPVLFHMTIRDNLLWAVPEADDAALEAALRAASAEFVLSLPGGMDTMVGDAGRRLSGGERQRIALARALLSDPALLILDEATSALDTGNEAAIARAVAGMREGRTILVISHRGALTDMADRIVTLCEGRVESVSEC